MIYSLFDLNEHIRRVLALNFQRPLWVAAEIAQVGLSRGHYYLDLVQKGEGDDIVAQSQAVLWASEYRKLRSAIGPDLDALLREGLEVKLQVRVDFHERYGLKLLISDLDPSYTFGQMELRRRQTLQTLRELGFLELNRSLRLPPVLQRVAVVSSEGAAGYQDFREHLSKNNFGYRFHTQLFASSVQGKNAEAELRDALTQIALQPQRFDCVVVVRGGGARLDLAAFDGLELCKTVAQMPLPVLSGIGHEVDETVFDLVAHAALKTPTAVADFLLQHNLLFENEMLRLADAIRAMSEYRFKISLMELERLETATHWSTRERVRVAAQKLETLEENLPGWGVHILRGQRRHLEQAEAFCSALHPDNVLRRGFSLTFRNGQVLTAAKDAKAGDWLETRLKEGVVRSKVE
ncbi:MAG: exodeoxyribonuclease VII large subunit [Saprospiraceae bacterium]|nr:exodeoxyribonuclease VII large subunit [Saprospiraceae bacterium]